MVLLWIEYLKECGRWIAVEVILPDLVYLVPVRLTSMALTHQVSAVQSYNRMTGSGRPALRRACTIVPGPLATYVRLCPLISASSRTPPSEIRWNGLSSARAID